MNKKKIVGGIAVITIAATIVGIYAYNTEYGEKDNEIKVLDYKSPEVVNEKGYEISKCEATNVKEWLEKNKLITLKDNGVYDNNEEIPVSYISIYDLDTKTYTDYKNTNVYKNMNYLRHSPSGKFILFAAPDEIPVEGREDKYYNKINILDLSTGEIIENFDKDDPNCDLYWSNYQWINDDYILNLKESKWRIMDKSGNVVKEGELDYTNSDSRRTFLMDISGIKAIDNNLDGSFYYQKVIRNSNKINVNEIYSMDINTKEEKFIGKHENLMNLQKKGDLLLSKYYITEDNAYIFPKMGFEIMDIEGNEVQRYESKERPILSAELSPDGEKCIIIDYDSNKSDISNKEDLSLKVMDIKSGEIKEIAPCASLIDGTKNMETLEGIEYLGCDNMWNSDGTSLIINNGYVLEKGEETQQSTYIITFDK